MIAEPKMAFLQKYAYILICLIGTGFLVYKGKSILGPFLFSIIFAILLLPLASFFETKLRLHRGIASMLSIFILIIFIGIIVYILGSQIVSFREQFPVLNKQFAATQNDILHWVKETFHLKIYKQMVYINKFTASALTASTAMIGAILFSLSTVLLFLIFIYLFTFFMLFYRRLLMQFLLSLFKDEDAVTIHEIVGQAQYIIKKYIIGLFIEMGIVTGAVTLILFLIGAKYALLLGLITGVFNIIPYVGIFSSLALSALITFAIVGPAKALLVAIGILVVHLVDSNILMPTIVGSKVKINALATLTGVFIGEMMWGIPGMFLSVPIMAIFKIIFDRVESLHSWGILFGDEESIKALNDSTSKSK